LVTGKHVIYNKFKNLGVDYKCYENGQKMSEASFKDGKLLGVYTEWDEEGKIDKENKSDPPLADPFGKILGRTDKGN